MRYADIEERAKKVLMKQLEILESGSELEKETAIKVMNAVSEMLEVIL